MTSKKDEELIPFESRHLIERLDEAYPRDVKLLTRVRKNIKGMLVFER